MTRFLSGRTCVPGLLTLCLVASPASAKKGKKGKKKKEQTEQVETPVAPTGPAIEVRFGWPSGGKADVVYRETRTKSEGTAVTSNQSEYHYSVLVNQTPDGFDIDTVDMQIKTDMFDEMPAHIRDTLLNAMSTQTAYQVSADGLYLGMSAGPDLTAAFGSIIANAKEGVPEEAWPMIDQILGPISTPEFLRSTYQKSWENFPGFWAGPAYLLPTDVTHSAEKTVETPFGVNLNGVVEFGIKDVGIPCNDADLEGRCARFWTIHTPAEAGLKQLLDTLLAPMLAALPPEADEEVAGILKTSTMSMEVRLQVVADPANLMPYSFTENSLTTVVMQIPGEGTMATGNTVATEAVFHWHTPAPTGP